MGKIIFGLIVLFFLSGCATPPTNKILESDRYKLNLIKVGSIIIQEPLMHYSGPLSIRNAGAFFMEVIAEFSNQAKVIHPAIQFGGIPFTLAAEVLKKSEIVAFQMFIENENNILINQIILDELMTKLQQTDKIQLVGSHNEHLSLATLNIIVSRYGFSNVFLTSNLVPNLNLIANLTDKDGKKFWSHHYNYSNNTDFTAIPLDDLKLHPELIKESWHTASKILIANIINDLTKNITTSQSLEGYASAKN
ncbi:MAG TPA: hypothetical protein PLV19_11415 [Nitrosomonas sp.]|nr:hypothetical protein [Nitrosomonas sp.]HQX14758.1 hypothetical protein [Nitrosomonas sp.]HRB33766.1 hypothetical protein [Nitrosomonas sp.]HRB46688.1 hypothetical protein [Nitrosomonas sp.]